MMVVVVVGDGGGGGDDDDKGLHRPTACVDQTHILLIL